MPDEAAQKARLSNDIAVMERVIELLEEQSSETQLRIQGVRSWLNTIKSNLANLDPVLN